MKKSTSQPFYTVSYLFVHRNKAFVEILQRSNHIDLFSLFLLFYLYIFMKGQYEIFSSLIFHITVSLHKYLSNLYAALVHTVTIFQAESLRSDEPKVRIVFTCWASHVQYLSRDSLLKFNRLCVYFINRLVLNCCSIFPSFYNIIKLPTSCPTNFSSRLDYAFSGIFHWKAAFIFLKYSMNHFEIVKCASSKYTYISKI